MNINDKYLEALKQLTGWVTISQWGIKAAELFPDHLETANKQAATYDPPSTGLREITARISSQVSRGAFAGHVEIDESERPRKVRYLSESEQAQFIAEEISRDTEPFTREQKVKKDLEALNTKELYRLEEMESISSALNSFFRIDFEVDHSSALLNPQNPGQHHPDNIQIILKSHNRMKSNNNWMRFSLEEQIEYIKAAVKLQSMVAKKMKVDMDEKVIESIIQRLKLVF